MYAGVFRREDNLVGLVADAFDDLNRDEPRGELAVDFELEVAS